jgi:hypothetical protein
MSLPDGAAITQAEVPKIIHDEKRGIFYLLISACNRLREDQADVEVSKTLRLYKSDNLRGPWAPYKKSGAILSGLENGFGASILAADFEKNELKIICPITENAPLKYQLTFAPVKTISLNG